jgi:F-type H+-transporting ATPase subunit c
MEQEITSGITNAAYALLSAGFGAGLVTFGAGFGIGKIAAAAMEGIARQPEATPKIQTTMIIAAALIEGVALFSAVICFMLSGK